MGGVVIKDRKVTLQVHNLPKGNLNHLPAPNQRKSTRTNLIIQNLLPQGPIQQNPKTSLLPDPQSLLLLLQSPKSLHLWNVQTHYPDQYHFWVFQDLGCFGQQVRNGGRACDWNAWDIAEEYPAWEEWAYDIGMCQVAVELPFEQGSRGEGGGVALGYLSVRKGNFMQERSDKTSHLWTYPEVLWQQQGINWQGSQEDTLDYWNSHQIHQNHLLDWSQPTLSHRSRRLEELR